MLAFMYRETAKMNIASAIPKTIALEGNSLNICSGIVFPHTMQKKSAMYPINTIFAMVPKPISFLPKRITRMKRQLFKRSCQFPKLKPRNLDKVRFIKVQGSVPRFTSIRNDRKKPIRKTPMFMMIRRLTKSFCEK